MAPVSPTPLRKKQRKYNMTEVHRKRLQENRENSSNKKTKRRRSSSLNIAAMLRLGWWFPTHGGRHHTSFIFIYGMQS